MPSDAIESLVAERKIRRLISLYCDAVSRRDAAAAASLFAPDARVRIADFPELVGQAAIGEGLQRTFAATGFLHMQCDAGLIDVEGDRARARLVVLEANRKPNQNDLGIIYGFYEDEYALLEGKWRFFRRRYTLQLRALLATSKIDQLADFIPSLTFAL